jgi:hypothetical protein
VILLVSLTKTRQYCDADEMLQKATTKNTYIYFLRKLGKKLIYDVMTIGVTDALSTMLRLLGEELEEAS